MPHVLMETMSFDIGGYFRRVIHDVRGEKLLRGPPCTRRCRAVTWVGMTADVGEREAHSKATPLSDTSYPYSSVYLLYTSKLAMLTAYIFS